MVNKEQGDRAGFCSEHFDSLSIGWYILDRQDEHSIEPGKQAFDFKNT